MAKAKLPKTDSTLNLWHRDNFLARGDIFYHITTNAKLVARAVKYSWQRIHEGISEGDLFEFDNYFFAMIERAMLRYRCHPARGVPNSIYTQVMQTYYNIHKDDIECDYDHFYTCCMESPHDKWHYGLAEDMASGAWDNILATIQECFHDANRTNAAKVMEVNGLSDDDYEDYRKDKISEGFQTLYDYIGDIFI